MGTINEGGGNDQQVCNPANLGYVSINSTSQDGCSPGDVALQEQPIVPEYHRS